MPITVTLRVQSKDEKVLALLNECPELSKQKPRVLGDEAFFDITELAIEEDIYANKNQMSDENSTFLKQFETENVFTPEVFKFPNILGTFNKNFLRFVKHCALNADSFLSVTYEHERGDNLYEFAAWDFDYSAENTNVVEQLYIDDCDNGYKSDIKMYRDGKVEKEDFSKK